MPTIAEIKQVVADEFGVSVAEIDSPSRMKRASVPRHMVMALARELTPHSARMIGRHVGNRDGNTVLEGAGRVHEKCVIAERFKRLKAHLS